MFDKGNNSKDNIDDLTSKMSFVASAKSEQAETLMDISLNEYKYLYTNSKEHQIFGYRTKHTFLGREFTTRLTQTLSLDTEKSNIFER